MKHVLLTIAFTLSLALAFAQQGPGELKVRIYPNPATEYINVSFENVDISDAQVSIHSIIGNKMKVEIEKLRGGNFRAGIADLPSGYYLVVVKDQDENFNRTYKFLKR